MNLRYLVHFIINIIRFNNEVYPLKNLLVSKTLSGDSSDSIKKAIVLLIHNEDKQKPLTDEAIVSKLEELDLYCSRRSDCKISPTIKYTLIF